MTDFDQHLQNLRQKLLDLTMRNRLLNYRPSKARTIRVIDELPEQVYKILVLQEKDMEFQPKSPDNLFTQENEPSEETESNTSDQEDAEKALLWKMPTETDQLEKKHTDRLLQTTLESEVLQKRLFYINQEARSVVEEQGYTVLFIALGYLEWTEESHAEEVRRAPLILVPVELSRANVGSAFKLHWTGEDIFTNISLQAKVAEQGITLPTFDMPEAVEGISDYFQQVSTAITKMTRWRVVTDIYLDFFSFNKFVMYKDLDPKTWPANLSPSDHPLVREILSPSGNKSSRESFSEDDIDQKLDFRTLYHVMDADPSQIAAIEDIKAGENLVVEGPPGTGKSQTITNTIAELLAQGKSVLFVSEKMAALEVVKSRLDRVGLGTFVLELHSHKAKKKQFLKELEDSIHDNAVSPPSWQVEFDQHEKLRAELNAYSALLARPTGKLNLSLSRLFALHEKVRRHFKKKGRPPHRLTLPHAEQLDTHGWNLALHRLTNLSEALDSVMPILQNPWRGCRPGVVLPSDQDEIGQMIHRSLELLRAFQKQLHALTDLCKLTEPRTFQDFKDTLVALKVIAQLRPVDKTVLARSEWNDFSEPAQRLVVAVSSYQANVAELAPKFTESVLEKDIPVLADAFKRLSSKWFKLFNRNYRTLKMEIQSLYVQRYCRRNVVIRDDLAKLEKVHQQRQHLLDQAPIGVSWFGHYWKGPASNPQDLKTLGEWIVSLRQQIQKGVLQESILEEISRGLSQSQVASALDALETVAKAFVKSYRPLVERLKLDHQATFGQNPDQVPFEEIGNLLQTWQEQLHRLQLWSQFQNLLVQCQDSAAAPLVEIIQQDQLSPDDLAACFEGNYAEAMLRIAFEGNPLLTSFVGEFHEKKIRRFMKVDQEIISVNRQRLGALLHQRRPTLYQGASDGSEAGILLGEINRKRGHKPIRKLMSLAGGLIQKIKPCFMMSPLSIAQFLDPKTARFDVIIFDEASQVRPEDAVGALLRGKQVTVMGDTRQLPPTSFFDHIVESSEEEETTEAASAADVQSILHQCKRCFPVKMLRWHYRSRHESLIAVSNREFYDNRLLIYPSFIDRSEYLGLHMVHLREAVYDRGRSSVNRQEAKAVAQAAVDHFRKYPGKSLGVGTFNVKQQQAILEEIEFQIQQNPQMESFFSSDQDDHFFVKNLETIQGDERDVIFISVGFGFDESHRLSMNFGPLNQEGGERRLNVLITRARDKCVVFCNFQAKDLSVDSSTAFGVRALKTFLEYAETRNFSSTLATQADTDSPFEDAVYEFLRDHGCDVRKQVGCAGFRVDMAVVDSRHPGQYLVGIECDGAKYHSSPVARDRDRLRQQILENLGWRIHRIWSTDWYRNRTATEKKLLEVIDQFKTMSRNDPVASVSQHSSQTYPVDTPASEPAKLAVPVTPIPSLEKWAPDYTVCQIRNVPRTGELHKCSPYVLADAVVQVVEVEGPVHVDEVIRRIRDYWGVRRTGERIRSTIARAIQVAVMQAKAYQQSDFLWKTSQQAPSVRRRRDDPPAKIDLICDEELAQAVKQVLKVQHATVMKDLIVQASRLLGFQATTEGVIDRCEQVINALILRKELQQQGNGMINIAA